MSIYTSVLDVQVHSFLLQYGSGDFVSLQGITRGTINSNCFLTTSAGRCVLTVFEILRSEEPPFFLELNQHLSQNGIACTAPIARKDDGLHSVLAGKPACLVACLNGSDTGWPTEAQCFRVDAILTKMHLAGQDFPLEMKDPRYGGWWYDAYTQLFSILDSEDAELLQAEIAALDENLGEHLPSGIIHADLFKDNVLLNEDEVPGFIDFYYTYSGNFMYDLAVTVNDWARITDNKLDSALYGASIHGYESVRPLSDEEHIYFPTAQRAGCIRFWVSRLLDLHFPQSSRMTFVKDPDVFRDLLLSLR